MSKREERLRPTAYVRITLPGGLPWRKKKAEVSFKAVGETDFEMWSTLIRDSLDAMGYDHPAFVVGFFLDVMNRLPDDIRKGLMLGIGEGLGTIVEPDEDGNGISITHEPMYPPLVQHEETVTKSGLVIPTAAISNPDKPLVLP